MSRAVHSWLTWCVLVAVAVRLPTLDSPVGSDEGGLLLVGESWGQGGASLYGAYWVDRPPLLVAVHELAARTGGAVSLRVIGCLAAVATVVAAWLAGRAVAGQVGARWSAVVATAGVSAPGIGWPHVSSELLAVPCVIGAVGVMVHALDEHHARQGLLLATFAGVLAACAPLLKQNLIGGCLAIGALLVVALLRRHITVRRALALALAALTGAAATVTTVVVWSALRGTYPGELWQALVCH